MTRFDPVVLGDVEVEKLHAVRLHAEALAQAIERIPSGRERSLALTKVEEAVWWAGRATAVGLMAERAPGLGYGREG